MIRTTVLGTGSICAVLTLERFNAALATVIALLTIAHLIIKIRKETKR